MIDGTPPAEYGQAGGFVTDTVLKSGTNAWHGSLFEYNRIQALAANSWFSNAAGQQDHLIRNQFGGSVGGPIIKDKTFFYFTTEFHRLRTSSPLTGNTYTSDFAGPGGFVDSGAFAGFIESDPNGICNNQVWLDSVFGAGEVPAAPCPGAFSTTAPYGVAGVGNAALGPVYSSIASAQHPVLCTSTAANCTNLVNLAQGLWTGPVLGAAPITYPVPIYGTVTISQSEILNQARYAVKMDHKLGAKDQLNGAYLYDNGDVTVPYGGNNTFGPTEYNRIRAQTAGITWAHTFSSNVLNQARFSYVRHTGNFPGDPSVAGVPDIFAYFDEPTIGLGNAANIPQFFTENEFIFKDDVSISKGKHNFKTGGEYRRTRNGSSFDSYKNGVLAMMDTGRLDHGRNV